MRERHDSVPAMSRQVGDRHDDPVYGRIQASGGSGLALMVAASVAVHLLVAAATFGRALVELATPPAAAATLIAIDTEPLVPLSEPGEIPIAAPQPRQPVVQPPPQAHQPPRPTTTPPAPQQHPQTPPSTDPYDDPDEAPARATRVLATDDPYGDGAPVVNSTYDGSAHGFASGSGSGSGVGSGRAVRSAPPAPEPAKPSGPMSMRDVDQRPQALSAAQPAYPRAALRQRSEGSVRLRVLIDVQGNVAAVSVVSASGHPSLRSASVSAAKQWRFSPARYQGRAVPVWAPRTLTFKLPPR